MTTLDKLCCTTNREEVSLALRELLAKNAYASELSAETLAKLLCAERLLSFVAETYEVEVVLEALRVEESVLA